jgi:hypothetical protein
MYAGYSSSGYGFYPNHGGIGTVHSFHSFPFSFHAKPKRLLFNFTQETVVWDAGFMMMVDFTIFGRVKEHEKHTDLLVQSKYIHL